MRCWVILLLLLPQLDAEELRAGAAAVRITPPAGIPMAGYYRIRLAEGTHDDLYAKAIVMQAGHKTVAMVACDLVGIDRDIVEEARRQVEAATGVPAAHVMISATHSHTGPLMSRRFLANAPPEPLRLAEQFRSQLPVKIAESVKKALSAASPAGVSRGLGHEESVAFYRRFLMKDGTVRFNPGKMNPDIVQPAGSIDPDLAVVRFDAAPDSPLALYVNYALHLDTVGGAHFSADYPYWMAKMLGKIYGPGMTSLFTIGAAGNINHIDVKDPSPQKGHEEARRIGTVLAGEVLKTITRLKPVQPSPLQVSTEIVNLPLPKFTADEVAAANSVAATFGKDNQAPVDDLVHAFKVLDVTARQGKPLEAEVQIISLGQDLAWVALPGEIFVELGVAIKKASPFKQTIIVGLANGSISYVPTRKGFTEGSYEAISARFAPGGGELLADTAIRLLAALHRSAARP
jgi:hypothetical protein